MNKGNLYFYISCLGLMKLSNHYFPNSRINTTQPQLMKYQDIVDIFEIKDQLFKNQYKNILHLSTPFNRKIKYIYNLPFFYTEYENYNFNKLSDFFLNIHIFIN